MSGRLSKALSRVSSELEELLYKISLEITDLHRGVATGANVGGTVFAQALQDVQQDVDEVEEKMGVVEALTVDNTPMDELLGYGVQLYEQHMQDLGALEQYLEQFGYEPTYDEPAPADPLTATDEVLEETRGFSDCSDAFLDTSELSPLSYHSPLQPITNLEHRSQPAAADTAAKPAVGIVQQQQQLKQQMARCSLGSSVTSGSVRTPDCLAAADNGGDAAASRSTSSISTPPLLHGPLPSPLLLPHGGEAAAAELLQLEEGVQEQAADAPGQPLPSPMLFPASPWAAAAPSDAGPRAATPAPIPALTAATPVCQLAVAPA